MSNRKKAGGGGDKPLSINLGRPSLMEIKAAQQKLAVLERRQKAAEGGGDPIGPKNTIVQQWAAWWVYDAHDVQGLSFEAIAELSDPPVTREAARLKYHALMERYGGRPKTA